MDIDNPVKERKGEARRYDVASRSKESTVCHLVDLDEQGGYGQCGCEHFAFRILPALSQLNPADFRQVQPCWHILKAREYEAKKAREYEAKKDAQQSLRKTSSGTKDLQLSKEEVPGGAPAVRGVSESGGESDPSHPGKSRDAVSGREALGGGLDGGASVDPEQPAASQKGESSPPDWAVELAAHVDGIGRCVGEMDFSAERISEFCWAFRERMFALCEKDDPLRKPGEETVEGRQ